MNERQHLDHEALAELKDVMDEEFDILINTYLQDARERMALLQKAADDEDPSEYAKVAHSFKGSCINIGAPRLADFCLQAERAGKNEDLSESERQITAIREEFSRIDKELRVLLENGG